MNVDDARAMVMQALRTFPPTERKYAAVVSDFPADFVDRFGYDFAARMAGEIIRSGKPLPPPLDRFVLEVLEGKGKRKQRGPKSDYYRDTAISYAIFRAVSAGLNPYRNDAAEEISACDLVAKCLSEWGIYLSYKRVAEIWADMPTSPPE